jgi:hypothetical protein
MNKPLNVTGNIGVSGTVDGVDIQTLNTTAGAALPKAGGTMTGSTIHNDNVKDIYGTSSDGLEIYHSGAASFISDTGTGVLYITGNQIYFKNAASNEAMLGALEDGTVTLYYDDAAKLSTTSTGIDVTGASYSSGNIGLNVDNYLGFSDDSFARFVVNDTEILRATAAGNVGIGTDSPTSILNVHNSTGSDADGARETKITFSGVKASGAVKNTGTIKAVHLGTGNDSNGRLEFEGGQGGTAMTIESLGNVGIGTTSPGSMLDIKEADSNSVQKTVRILDSDGTQQIVFKTTPNDGGYTEYYADDGTTVSTRIGGGYSTLSTYFNNGGNVGIGTTSPGAQLEIGGGSESDRQFEVTNTGNNAALAVYKANGATGYDVDSDSGYILEIGTRDGTGHESLYTRGKTILAATTGNVGIGVTDPAAKLEVNGQIKIDTALNGDNSMYVHNTYAGGYGPVFYGGGAASAQFQFKVGNYAGTQSFLIDAGGNFTGSATSDISDERLKENITTITDSLTKINALKGRTFNWKSEAEMPSGLHYGLIAQEIESVIPELVHDESGIRSFDKDGNIKLGSDAELETDEWAKSVTTTGLIPVLVEAIKELSAKVTALENA